MENSIHQAAAHHAKPGWLGIPAATAAFFGNAHLFFARLPGTPLRVLSLMAISAALEARGIPLDATRKRALIDTMELGAHLNDRFDGDPHNPADFHHYISSFSRSFHRDCICSYIKRLRHFERKRPVRTASAREVRIYRENVNRVSLATLWAIATQGPIDVAEREIRTAADLRILFRIVMIAQIIDDVLDIRKDRKRGLPSFATANDSNSHELFATVKSYSHPAPLGLHPHFCLHFLLRTAARSARTAIACRRASGWIAG